MQGLQGLQRGPSAVSAYANSFACMHQQQQQQQQRSFPSDSFACMQQQQQQHSFLSDSSVFWHCQSYSFVFRAHHHHHRGSNTWALAGLGKGFRVGVPQGSRFQDLVGDLGLKRWRSSCCLVGGLQSEDARCPEGVRREGTRKTAAWRAPPLTRTCVCGGLFAPLHPESHRRSRGLQVFRAASLQASPCLSRRREGGP